MARKTDRMTASARLKPCTSGHSSASPNARLLCHDSKIVMARPTDTADTKKKTGSMGEYQSGYSLFGTIRYRLPKEDRCRVERMTPAIMIGSETMRSQRRVRFHWKRSSTTGTNSRARTVVYKVTHQPTSNITEWGFHMMSGCQIRSGRPRSYINANTTRR